VPGCSKVRKDFPTTFFLEGFMLRHVWWGRPSFPDQSWTT
jgi:hypothetical protein